MFSKPKTFPRYLSINTDDIWTKLNISNVFFILRCVSISGTYPGQFVGKLVYWSVTLSDFHSLWTVTERSWTTGRDIFSESYDQPIAFRLWFRVDFSNVHFYKVFLVYLKQVSVYSSQSIYKVVFLTGPPLEVLSTG